jgi:aryl-alcohol dehydrogenase-like predicted oxidoreductase
MLNHRTLGKTGRSVSELGFGTWGLAGTMWVGADDEESLRSLRQAIDAGVDPSAA